MRTVIFASIAVLAFWSCTKESPEKTNQEAMIPKSEFEALKQEVMQLKSQVAAFSSSDPTAFVTVEAFNELKQENEHLKEQIGLFTSGFFCS